MGWVESEDVENLDGTWLRWEGLDIVTRNLKIFEQSVGRSEAVSHGDSVNGEDWIVLTLAKTIVLESLDEAKNVSVGVGGIDGETGHDSHTDAATERLSTSQRVTPSEAVRIDMTILVDETGETSSEFSLEAILSGINSLLSPCGVNSSLSTLVK